MRNILCVMVLLLPLFAQGRNFDGGLYVIELGDRPVATCADAVTMFMLQAGKTPADYNKDSQTLREMGIGAPDREADKALRRGEAALMAARYLNLKGSLFYVLFGTERYAVRACAAAEIMTDDCSEWDTLSGEELLEIMRLTGEKAQGGNR